MRRRRDTAVRGYEFHRNSAEVAAQIVREEAAARQFGVDAAGLTAAVQSAPQIPQNVVEQILTAYEGGRRP